MVTENYRQVCAYLEARYPEIDGYNFYRDIFPDNENAGELHEDFSHPNAIYLYKDEQDPKRRALRRRIMLNDTWEEDYTEFVEENPMTLCSGLTYHSRANRLKDAQCMNALIFDLDGVGLNESRVCFCVLAVIRTSCAGCLCRLTLLRPAVDCTFTTCSISR